MATRHPARNHSDTLQAATDGANGESPQPYSPPRFSVFAFAANADRLGSIAPSARPTSFDMDQPRRAFRQRVARARSFFIVVQNDVIRAAKRSIEIRFHKASRTGRGKRRHPSPPPVASGSSITGSAVVPNDTASALRCDSGVTSRRLDPHAFEYFSRDEFAVGLRNSMRQPTARNKIWKGRLRAKQRATARSLPVTLNEARDIH